MRPVERGEAPRVYSAYRDALDDLVVRMGTYCSYCERRLPTSLAVEHVAPKSLHPDLETTWENFLLGCTNCNSVKLNKPVNDEDFLWPDRDNTLLAFRYEKGGFVSVAKGLADPLGSQAAGLMDLVGLDRHNKAGWPDPASRDKRWQQREEVWELAERCRDGYLVQIGRSDPVFELIVEMALGYGFFSVWMTVFIGDSDLRPRLIAAFTGTADCFDSSGAPVNRAGGKI